MTLGSVIVLANLMTDESRKAYRTKNPGTTWELEGTIRLKFKTIDELKELGYNNNQTYDQLIQMLVRSYKKSKLEP